MRTVIRAVRQFGPAFRYKRNSVYNGSLNTYSHSAYSLARNVDVCRCRYPSYKISRAISADAAPYKVANAELNRDGPLMEYKRRIAAGELLDGDTCQLSTLGEIQRLYDELIANADACRLDRHATSEKAGRPCNWRKKRIHFHDFMLNVHSRLQKQKGVVDPLEVVAGELSDESILLCLDEFMVTDVADALILNRLFRHLFSNGSILVATSNRAPDKLYEGGLQRDLFLQFIATLKERCVVHEISSSADYRKMTSVHE